MHAGHHPCSAKADILTCPLRTFRAQDHVNLQRPEQVRIGRTRLFVVTSE
jgi:hypothetical protein